MDVIGFGAAARKTGAARRSEVTGMSNTRVARRLIRVEIKRGFLYVPSHAVQYFPRKGQKVAVTIDDEHRELTYNADHRRVFGLTSWYKVHKASVGDEVVLSVSGKNSFALQFRGKVSTPTRTDKTVTRAIDLSGLSSQAKGDIVEDRIKELLMLHGEGLLHVFKPVTDTEGVDLIVTKAGEFHPIFLQVKGRYTLHGGRSMIVTVNKKTFTPHQAYYIVAAYFDPDTLQLADSILLIPSRDLEPNAVLVKKYDRYQLAAPLDRHARSRWAKYLVSKRELASRLLEHFEAMNCYYR